MAVPQKYEKIDFTPPEGVRKAAERGLAYRREHGRGGTPIGVARARDLANGKQLSPQTVKRMKAFFDRHAKNSKAEGFRPGEKGWPSNGKIADLLWGGPAGRTWAEKVVRQMEAADEKEGRSLRPFGSSQGLKPRVTVVFGPPASGKTTYVEDHKGDNDVVFDFNKVMSAITGGPMYNTNENLVSYCTDIRTLIIDKAIRSGKADHTWIIVTSPDDTLKERLKDVPVNYVEMTCSEEECLERIDAEGGRPGEHKDVVKKYFSESRSVAMQGVERRFVGSPEKKPAKGDLSVERRTDPQTGKQQVYLVGYAAKFHTDSLMMGDFIERIAPEAFEIVERGKDFDGKPLETRGLYNHDPNHLIGRYPDTMKLTVDKVGLRYQILLPESRHDLAELVSRGDLRGSSFSFVVADDGERWSTEDGQSIRTVTKIKSLLDCGPVTYPAYADSTVAVAQRSYQQYKLRRKSPSKTIARRVSEIKSFLAERRVHGTSKSGVAQKRPANLLRRETASARASRIAREIIREHRDCGTGKGGFQKGNSCAGGSGSSSKKTQVSPKKNQPNFKGTSTSEKSFASVGKSFGDSLEITRGSRRGSVSAAGERVSLTLLPPSDDVLDNTLMIDIDNATSADVKAIKKATAGLNAGKVQATIRGKNAKEVAGELKKNHGYYVEKTGENEYYAYDSSQIVNELMVEDSKPVRKTLKSIDSVATGGAATKALKAADNLVRGPVRLPKKRPTKSGNI